MKIYHIIAYSEAEHCICFNEYHCCPVGVEDTSENAVKYALKWHPNLGKIKYPDVKFWIQTTETDKLSQISTAEGFPVLADLKIGPQTEVYYSVPTIPDEMLSEAQNNSATPPPEFMNDTTPNESVMNETKPKNESTHGKRGKHKARRKSK